jgi:hypothetical protein
MEVVGVGNPQARGHGEWFGLVDEGEAAVAELFWPCDWVLVERFLISRFLAGSGYARHTQFDRRKKEEVREGKLRRAIKGRHDRVRPLLDPCGSTCHHLMPLLGLS